MFSFTFRIIPDIDIAVSYVGGKVCVTAYLKQIQDAVLLPFVLASLEDEAIRLGVFKVPYEAPQCVPMRCGGFICCYW